MNACEIEKSARRRIMDEIDDDADHDDDDKIDVTHLEYIVALRI